MAHVFRMLTVRKISRSRLLFSIFGCFVASEREIVRLHLPVLIIFIIGHPQVQVHLIAGCFMFYVHCHQVVASFIGKQLLLQLRLLLELIIGKLRVVFVLLLQEPHLIGLSDEETLLFVRDLKSFAIIGGRKLLHLKGELLRPQGLIGLSERVSLYLCRLLQNKRLLGRIFFGLCFRGKYLQFFLLVRCFVRGIGLGLQLRCEIGSFLVSEKICVMLLLCLVVGGCLCLDNFSLLVSELLLLDIQVGLGFRVFGFHRCGLFFECKLLQLVRVVLRSIVRVYDRHLACCP